MSPVTDEELTFVLRAMAKEGVSPKTLAHHLVEVYRALNDYTLVKYKTAVRKDQFRRVMYEYAGVGVP